MDDRGLWFDRVHRTRWRFVTCRFSGPIGRINECCRNISLLDSKDDESFEREKTRIISDIQSIYAPSILVAVRLKGKCLVKHMPQTSKAVNLDSSLFAFSIFKCISRAWFSIGSFECDAHNNGSLSAMLITTRA